MVKETGLGKGVDLLFGNEDSDEEEKYFFCDVEIIIPNKYQPRSVFNEEDLKELSDSIRENGIIQPLIVKAVDDGKYELIAGERRLRASKLVGLESVPVVVNDVTDDNVLLELALIENIQRTDLNAIEEAEAYSKLIEKFGYTQEQTAKKVGKKRSTITNLLRLLNLPQFIKDDVSAGIISEGHARALLRLGDNDSKIKEIKNEIVLNKLSVRQTELLVKKTLQARPQQVKVTSNNDNGEPGIPPSYCNLFVNQLTNKLHSKVSICQNGSRGKLEIEYYSVEDLERLIASIVNE